MRRGGRRCRGSVSFQRQSDLRTAMHDLESPWRGVKTGSDISSANSVAPLYSW
jgi:hypothetical protein